MATASLSYDDVRGPYVGATLTLVATRRDGLQPLRSIQYIGYAQRVGSGIALDLGVTHRAYSHYYAGGYARDYAEFYVGASGPRWSSHVYVAPSYEGRNGSATYGEISLLLLSRDSWSVTGHVGLLAPPGRGGPYSRDPVIDWQLGATRRLGGFGLSLDWVGASSGGYSRRGHSGLVLSASRSF
ncbi:MAG: hypothetical protein JWO25_2595 [Alphaproteobacteria bacterium]|nr:hypothetical protein [Alphaproteobacteria bacterium]